MGIVAGTSLERWGLVLNLSTNQVTSLGVSEEGCPRRRTNVITTKKVKGAFYSKKGGITAANRQPLAKYLDNNPCEDRSVVMINKILERPIQTAQINQTLLASPRTDFTQKHIGLFLD